MNNDQISLHRQELEEFGYTVIADVFTETAIREMIAVIDSADHSGPLFRKTSDLFAIRRFLQVVPGMAPLVFSPAVEQIVRELFGIRHVPVKSIYFDKPGESNWFVAWHQDLTISVNQKLHVEGYGPWTVKPDQYAVQPPVDILQSIYTLRIHLDDTDEQNGALKVLPGSHAKGVYRADGIDLNQTPEVSCRVKKGGVMIMRPLLMHASGRSSNGHNRRVIHIEFSDRSLTGGLEWAEQSSLFPVTEA
ncbi:phytanoyl-CoA dioxygenase family protein [Chitinophaga arvensicola]|uniref:Ectoine hydroxylase-related dioxygenase, phytanoyl-CoA dioxygenase (PhyH) family n=1 Tax=Chitinophaga arvensicola TaxID=29529 RepID=A0A1I0SDZ4_9BACT|nr:phytanoyl-CoA dioxygenase family protein [Chitinophaga arvensicola]SEW57410.1 Ectoine hydroxylase-related dioxygenase, phytanoyl-CoA dioxygenase (PhyH) family [Chitinophaga arvensicola]